jgi:hypothetical protein
MKKISEMTPEELRIACAEKCGWKNIRWINSISGRWLCGDHPNKDSEIPKFNIDMNVCMELMEKIWGKYPDANICKYDECQYAIYWNYGYTKLSGSFVPDSFIVSDIINLAIMQAFLSLEDE